MADCSWKRGVTFFSHKRIVLGSVLAATILSGCAGTMQGMMRTSGEVVRFDFTETGMAHGTLKVVLVDGEQFQGKHVYQSSVSVGSGFGTAWSGSATASASAFGAVSTFSGNNEAVLFGDRGHTMRCRFRIADPVIGMTSGGVGLCQVSDGRVIDVQF